MLEASEDLDPDLGVGTGTTGQPGSVAAMLPALVAVAAQTFCGFPFPLFSLDLQNYLHEMFVWLSFLLK